MKFIGQFIQNFIARFRSDVYLENIESGTIASGGNLGLDSNNKIVKATEATGDITSVAIRTDTGSSDIATQTEGDAAFSILGGDGISVTNSGATITATFVPDKQLFIKQGSFSVNQGTDRVYFPMTGTAENTAANGISIPFIAPVNGKLLKIHFRSNKDHSGFVTTFTLLNWDSNEAFTVGNASDVGTKDVTMANQNNVTTIDFQSSLTSGTNVFTAGETVGISLQTASSIGETTKYWFTAVFEFDFSSY